MEKLIPKNAMEQVCIEVSEYHGKQYVDARVWWRPDETGDWRRTRKGLTLSPELARQVAEAIIEAVDKVEGGG